jgi:hypothetical protein
MKRKPGAEWVVVLIGFPFFWAAASKIASIESLTYFFGTKRAVFSIFFSLFILCALFVGRLFLEVKKEERLKDGKKDLSGKKENRNEK